MAGKEEPAVLPLGTEVSAKYKGAFCEAKVKKVIKNVKCKVTVSDTGGHQVVTDDDIKGPIKVGSVVEVRTANGTQLCIINKVTDHSTYTVVFNDGDENTLRRTQLCLKGEKHFVKSETLDDLPLSHPEHFGTPVMKTGKRLRQHDAGTDYDSDSSSCSSSSDVTYSSRLLQEMVGRVVCMEVDDRKRSSLLTPALVVLPGADPSTELHTADTMLVKSFRDSKFFPLLKKNAREFSRKLAIENEDKSLKSAYEKALLYFDTRELPPHWDRAELLASQSSSHSESSDGEPNEDRDRFVALLYKFMDERNTPINKGPTLGTKDLNLHKLFKVVRNLGGYNRVTNQMKWGVVHHKMSLPLHANTQLKAAYKKYLHAFEDFDRKLGTTMGTISRPGRSRHGSRRNIMSYRDREDSVPKSPRSTRRREEAEQDGRGRAKGSGTPLRVEDSGTESESSRRASEKRRPRDEEEETTRRTEEKTENKEAVREERTKPAEEEGAKEPRERRRRVRPVVKEGDDGDTPVTGDSDEDESCEIRTRGGREVPYPPGTKLKVRYGRGKTQKIYEAKILEVEDSGLSPGYLVHYAGWNHRYNEWIHRERIVGVVEEAPPAPDPPLKPAKTPQTTTKPKPPPPSVPSKPQSPVVQLIKKRGRPASTGQKEEKSGSKPPLPSAPKRAPPERGTTSTPPSDTKAPRPTRSTSVENTLSSGLPSKVRRTRRASGVQEPSDSARDDSESSSSSSEESSDDREEERRTRRSDPPLVTRLAPATVREQLSRELSSKVKEMAKFREVASKLKEVASKVKEVNTKVKEVEREITEEVTKEEQSSVQEARAKEQEARAKEQEEEDERKAEKEKVRKEEDGREEATGQRDSEDKPASTEPAVKETTSKASRELTSKEPPAKQLTSTVSEEPTSGESTSRESISTASIKTTSKEPTSKASREPPSREPTSTPSSKPVSKERATMEPTSREQTCKEPTSTASSKPTSREQTSTSSREPTFREATSTSSREPTSRVSASKEATPSSDSGSELTTSSLPATNTPTKGRRQSGKAKQEVTRRSAKPKRAGAQERQVESEETTVRKKRRKKEEEEVSEDKVHDEKLKVDHVKDGDVKVGDVKVGDVKVNDMKVDPLTSPTTSAPQLSLVAPSAVGEKSEPAGPPPQLSPQMPGAASLLCLEVMAPEAGSPPHTPPHAAAALFDNTPPDTPHSSPHTAPSLSPGSSEEQRVNMEVEQLMSGGLDCDTSTISNGSGGSSGNAPGSESEEAAASTQGPEEEEEEEEEEEQPKKRKRSHKRTTSDKSSKKNTAKHSMSDSDEVADSSQAESRSTDHPAACPTQSTSPAPLRHADLTCKYNFLDLGEGQYLEGEERIEYLMERIQELRKIYLQLKTEVAGIDRKRKRHKRKEREAAQASAAAAALAAVDAVASQPRVETGNE